MDRIFFVVTKKVDEAEAAKRKLSRLSVAILSHDAQYERDAWRPNHGDESEMTRSSECVFERRSCAAECGAEGRKTDKAD